MGPVLAAGTRFILEIESEVLSHVFPYILSKPVFVASVFLVVLPYYFVLASADPLQNGFIEK